MIFFVRFWPGKEDKQKKISETNQCGLGDWHGLKAVPGAAVAAAAQSLAIPRGPAREGAWGVSRREYFMDFMGNCGFVFVSMRGCWDGSGSLKAGKVPGHEATATPQTLSLLELLEGFTLGKERN